MSEITDNITAKVADLIKIKIKPEELPKYTSQLATALDPAAQLSELDTRNTAVLSHPTGLTTTGAEDISQPGLSVNAALENAARSGRAKLNYIVVPKVN
jgi:aspartyl/glutamyl-tRNA(Asn/Gln) amidotransferase C subunit